MNHIFIINPVSGKGNATKIIPEIERVMKKLSYSYEIQITTHPHHATEIAKNAALNNSAVRIYSCGGDGTLNEVVNGVANFKNVEIGAIPLGSGNDFIKSIGQKVDFESIKGQVLGSSMPIDLIKSKDRYCINICSCGFDSEVVGRKNKMRFLSKVSGAFSYFVSTFISLATNMKNHFIVTVDDNEPIEKDFLFVLAANGKYYGSSFKPTPNAEINDGLMDVMLINTLPRYKFVKLLGKYKTGEHIHLTDLCTNYLAHKVNIKSDKEFAVNMDGEVTMAKDITFEIVKNGTNFILPGVVKVQKLSRNITKKAQKSGAVVMDKSNC